MLDGIWYVLIVIQSRINPFYFRPILLILNKKFEWDANCEGVSDEI